ncbi:MAG: hypothetical protein CL912_09615 [Deltaproteobacteria bacterium]|nr:hypothetical protein [Deltaproteobacteria bacterium]
MFETRNLRAKEDSLVDNFVRGRRLKELPDNSGFLSSPSLNVVISWTRLWLLEFCQATPLEWTPER